MAAGGFPLRSSRASTTAEASKGRGARSPRPLQWLTRPESKTAHGFHRPRLLLFAFAPLLASSTNAEARELRICADTNRHRGRSSDQRKADTPDNVADADADLVAGAVEVQCGPAIADRQVVHRNMI